MDAKKKKWEGYNRYLIQEASVGDLLEFPRILYSHWAVYIGNEEVVHLAGIDDDGLNGNFNPTHMFTISGKLFKKAVVKRESVWNVVLNSKVAINNKKDISLNPFPPTKIVKMATRMIGEIGYNALWRNCEHFAAFCRYGVAWSKQADAALMLFSIILAIAILAAVYKLSRRR
ncbi:phospholipase A and acyltransferase 3-like [Magallana gigas]|uniref:phospholipase A and acyltransferase 3-like n=1 Tax=Magallana gigas TaxID=29159 RepID=UPI003340D7CF